jgi:hypothetical protein
MYLNFRPQALKLVQERVGNTLEVIDLGNHFLNRTPAAQQQRESIEKWDFMKLKASAQQKKWFLNLRGHPQSDRKYLLSTYQTKD